MLKIGKGTQYNSKTKTGWKREGDKWVYFEKGVKKPHAGVANKAALGIKKHVVTPVKNALRDFSRIGQLSDTYDPAKKKYLTKNELRAKNIQDKKSPGNKKLSSSIRGEQKKEEAKKNPEKKKDSSSTSSSSKKSSSSNRKKMGAIERKNREIHGGEAVDKLKIKHADWKKARKAGTLDKWKEKYKKK
tara:strand:+ start:20297 stop:20860 length:564 start_codon:yes stop_codon:yes gene_type:complete